MLPAPRIFIVTTLMTAMLSAAHSSADTTGQTQNRAGDGRSGPVAIAVHGGAGTISRAELTAEQEAAYRERLAAAVQAGHQILSSGGSSVQAVQAAVNLLEDAPMFNAGKGAVFNAEGRNELDASIMDGATRNAGAVASVRHVRNPIDLAISVMNNSRHVMLSGEGAEEFAREQGFDFVEPDYFFTEERWEALQRARARESAGLEYRQDLFSTVGAVALDQHGNLAAGTSTGGMTNKRFGRIGDSPIIGAGTFADNASCAVSATGHGEYFIRWVVAYDICQRVAAGASLADAAYEVVNRVLVKAGGDGGIIAVDAAGNIAMPFNTEGMYRASISTSGELVTGIYASD